jgi:SAM-dependent methyltransferase
MTLSVEKITKWDVNMVQNNDSEIRKAVKDQYRKIALNAGSSCGCSSTSCCSEPTVITQESLIRLSTPLGYTKNDLQSAPNGSNLALGCGNPQAIASLSEGEAVLDLGSGAGFDCFLAARQVGPGGKVLGIDMTPEMIKKASENAQTGGIHHVNFQLAEIEHLPLPSASFDVIISNCVINLSPNKELVFQEAYRVLKPGGRLAISDVFALVDLPEFIRKDPNLISACIAGAIPVEQLRKILSTTGFKEIQIIPHAKTDQIIHEWAPELNPQDFIQSAAIWAIK